MSVNKSVVRLSSKKVSDNRSINAKANSLVKKGFESKKVALRVAKKIEASKGRLSASNFVKSGERAGLMKKQRGGRGKLKGKPVKTKKTSMKKNSSKKASNKKDPNSSSRQGSGRESGSSHDSFWARFFRNR